MEFVLMGDGNDPPRICPATDRERWELIRAVRYRKRWSRAPWVDAAGRRTGRIKLIIRRSQVRGLPAPRLWLFGSA